MTRWLLPEAEPLDPKVKQILDRETEKVMPDPNRKPEEQETPQGVWSGFGQTPEDYAGAHSRHQWDSSSKLDPQIAKSIQELREAMQEDLDGLDPQTKDTVQGLALALTISFVFGVGLLIGGLGVWIVMG